MMNMNPLEKIYFELAVRKERFWIWFWYKLTRCPNCHQKIRWEKEFESIWDHVGYYIPYHLKEEQNDECEGVV